MFRKRREPAPFFRQPGAPFNPATGQHAQLTPFPAKGTTLALFQVVEDDTHDNYVVCRGYEAESDPEFRFLHDPYTVPTTTPINVAKPYAIRGTFPYVKGDVIVAARIKGKLGYNPGKAVTVGQPADLDEVISLLTDDDGVGISWMDVSTPPTAATPFAGLSYGTGVLYSSEGTTTQDISFIAGSHAANGGWTATGIAGNSFELTWNGPQTLFIFTVSCYVQTQDAAPVSDTDLLVGVRGDTGLGYLPNMQVSPVFLINHRFKSGIAPPARFSTSAHVPISVANGTKYKMSAQKYPGGDVNFTINLYACTLTITKAY